jgi:hypothetical protein
MMITQILYCTVVFRNRNRDLIGHSFSLLVDKKRHVSRYPAPALDSRPAHTGPASHSFITSAVELSQRGIVNPSLRLRSPQSSREFAGRRAGVG